MQFYKIRNSDGKVWFMPEHNMCMGMQLYQPSAWKGKLLKSFFPHVCRIDMFGLVKKALHIETCGCPLPDAVVERLKDIFHENDIEFSIFNGTPCAHQKITVQIYKRNRILGYCKLANKPELIEIFKREQLYLEWLKEREVVGIPECLCCNDVGEGTWMFVQTTKKTKSSKTRHCLGDLEVCFLEQFNTKTQIECAYHDTDMFQHIDRLRSVIDEFEELQKCWVEKAVDRVEEYYKQRENNVFSAYHSDFTPWNMFEENGDLFVFDWEYAGRTYMPYLDIIHYIVQTSVFEKNYSADKILDIIQTYAKSTVGKYFTDIKIATMAYLLDIISKYSVRDKGHETEDTRKMYSIRMDLLRMVCE